MVRRGAGGYLFMRGEIGQVGLVQKVKNAQPGNQLEFMLFLNMGI
jgi:hypothetical protein